MTVITPGQFVEAYLAQGGELVNRLDRLVDTPSGLDAFGMNEAIADPRLGRLGIPMMADFMAPTGSVYYDAIFGAFYGQHAIRNWLVPAMAEIEFVDFVPTAESVIFDDGLGGSSLDEWEMVAAIGEDRIPLSRGVSVRRYRNGFVTWACDVYDTVVMRQPPPPDLETETQEMPPSPNVDWSNDLAGPTAELSYAAQAWIKSLPIAPLAHSSGIGHDVLHEIVTNPSTADDVTLLGQLLHPEQAAFFNPQHGLQVGRSAILLALQGPSLTGGHRQPLGPALFDGSTSVQEWQRECQCSDSSTVMLRGTSVKRFSDGWLSYAADYFDTTPLAGHGSE